MKRATKDHHEQLGEGSVTQKESQDKRPEEAKMTALTGQSCSTPRVRLQPERVNRYHPLLTLCIFLVHHLHYKNTLVSMKSWATLQKVFQPNNFVQPTNKNHYR